jgi:hypothetical protein
MSAMSDPTGEEGPADKSEMRPHPTGIEPAGRASPPGVELPAEDGRDGADTDNPRSDAVDEGEDDRPAG